jgi:hypothetical protein
MAKEFKSGINRPTDAQVFETTKGIPFGTCKQCGLRTVTNQVICPECERLTEIGFGPVPRAFHTLPGQDTTPDQSYPASNHSGYKDTIPSGVSPAVKKGRV